MYVCVSAVGMFVVRSRSRGNLRDPVARGTPYSFGWVISSAIPMYRVGLSENLGTHVSSRYLVLKSICQQGLARLPPLYMRRSWRDVSCFSPASRVFPRRTCSTTNCAPVARYASQLCDRHVGRLSREIQTWRACHVKGRRHPPNVR